MDSAYALHLAMAALAGASVASVAAFYAHHKSLSHLLRSELHRCGAHPDTTPRNPRRKRSTHRRRHISPSYVEPSADVAGGDLTASCAAIQALRGGALSVKDGNYFGRGGMYLCPEQIELAPVICLKSSTNG